MALRRFFPASFSLAVWDCFSLPPSVSSAFDLLGAPSIFPVSSSSLPFCRSSVSPVFNMPTVSCGLPLLMLLPHVCWHVVWHLHPLRPSCLLPLPALRRLAVREQLRCRRGCFARVFIFVVMFCSDFCGLLEVFMDSNASRHSFLFDVAFLVVLHGHAVPSFLVFGSLLFSVRCNVSPSCGGLGRCHASSSAPLGAHLIQVPRFTTTVTCHVLSLE